MLTFFDVRLSTAVLGVGLISEVVMLLIFDVAMFAHGHIPCGAPSTRSTRSRPSRSGSAASSPAGAIGIGLFFAFWSWVGFEMAPNYGEESREPEAERAAGAVHLGDRPRHLLHPHLAGPPFAGLLDSIDAAADRRRTTRPSTTSPGDASSAAGSRLGAQLS